MIVRFLSRLASGPFFAHVGEAYSFGFHLLLTFLFEVGQAEILEDHGRQLFHCDFGCVVIDACLFARIAFFAFAGTRLLGDDITDLAFAVALTGVLLASGIIAETILFE